MNMVIKAIQSLYLIGSLMLLLPILNEMYLHFCIAWYFYSYNCNLLTALLKRVSLTTVDFLHV